MSEQSLFVEYLSGVAGGISVVLIGHPFDTTKTRLQSSPPKFYAGTFDCIKKTFQVEGLSGFYKGMGSALWGQMVFRALSFATFHHSVKYITERNESEGVITKQVPRASDLLVAGAFTGFVISFIETPIDLIKTRQQIEVFTKSPTAPTTSVSTHIKQIIQRNGIRGLWQGWSGTVVRNIPANGVFFPVNDIVKNEIAKANNIPVSDIQLHHRIIAGAAAGLAYWVGTYPLDAVKARMMSTPFDKHTSWLKTAQTMAKEGGWRAFTRGLGPCAVRAIPVNACMFAIVDIVRETLTKGEFHFQFFSTDGLSNALKATERSNTLPELDP